MAQGVEIGTEAGVCADADTGAYAYFQEIMPPDYIGYGG